MRDLARRHLARQWRPFFTTRRDRLSTYAKKYLDEVSYTGRRMQSIGEPETLWPIAGYGYTHRPEADQGL